MSEHTEQAALFQWAGMKHLMVPELRLLYAVPNAGKRSYGAASYMVAEGLKAGVPDICLPVARQGFHGLYIELKYGKNKPSPDQERWLFNLDLQGYRVELCYGWEAARDVIENYLDIDTDTGMVRIGSTDKRTAVV